MPDITPFPIDVPEPQLADLVDRLDRVRLPEAATVADGSQGPPLDEVRALLAHWRDRYDWRRAERELNDLGSSRFTASDGTGIHVLHSPSPHPDALPLVLCHGWPGSVFEFRHVVAPLTDPTAHGGLASDAFHVVIPSMPGFGFSDKPTATGWGIGRIAQTWIELMDALGYGERWGAQGGDWGSAVVEAITRMRPPGLVGAHTNAPMVFPTPQEIADADEDERGMIDDAGRYQAEISAYSTLQATRPQTIGYALADSPAGQAAWILALFRDVSDSGGDPLRTFGADEILDDVMLYWLANAGASSARLYWEARREHAATPPPSTPNPVPMGFSVFPHDPIRASRRWIEQRYSSVVHYDHHQRGGHFAALEHPDALVAGVRETFRTLRETAGPGPSPIPAG